MKKILLPLLSYTMLFASSGESLYNKNCKSCHGLHANKKAMGKSKALKGMSVSEIEKSMKAYASGEKKSMSAIKKVKKTFIKKYSNDDLHAVASYIHKL